MSDLPNFKRSLFRRLGGFRTLGIAAVALLAALAWVYATEIPIQISNVKGHHTVYIGAEYALQAHLMNVAEKSFSGEIQAALVSLGGCVEKGKTISFSNPWRASMAPYKREEPHLTFPSVVAPCDSLKLGVKIYVNGKIDQDRVTFSQDIPGLTLDIL